MVVESIELGNSVVEVESGLKFNSYFNINLKTNELTLYEGIDPVHPGFQE